MFIVLFTSKKCKKRKVNNFERCKESVNFIYQTMLLLRTQMIIFIAEGRIMVNFKSENLNNLKTDVIP